MNKFVIVCGPVRLNLILIKKLVVVGGDKVSIQAQGICSPTLYAVLLVLIVKSESWLAII